MSYLEYNEYRIVPVESLRIIRNCSGCGGKMSFVNSNRFRINANGNCIDVWLIYQCEKCKHPYNLPIYERVSPRSIQQAEYQKFLENDPGLAFHYGTDLSLMRKNKAEIDWNFVPYEIVGITPKESHSPTKLVIRNPFGIQVRTDKVLSELMGISRQEIKKMVMEKKIGFSNKKIGDFIEISFLESAT